MNWVKTRLSVREDKLRMKQREFFANKKLEKQTQMKQVHQPGSGMSLDLLAVNISNREKPKSENQPPPKVVKVDLDKLNPYRRTVKNVDLGPLSPTKRSLALHPDISSSQRSVVSDVSSVAWQPSSFLSSQPVPASSRSVRRDILPPLMPQTKFLQTTHQNENSRSKTKFEQKAQLTLSDSVRPEPETPFVPFSKPGPRVTFNNKTETWSYSCSSSSSTENSSREKSRSSASEFSRAHLHEDFSPLGSTATQTRYPKNLFESEDFQEVSEPCATENWCHMKGGRNEKHSTNTLGSDFEILKESSCLGEKYHFKNTGSRFRGGTSTESETKGRFLPTLKSQMCKMEGNLMSIYEDNTSGEQNTASLDIHAGRYSDFQNRKVVDLCNDRHRSDRSSANHAPGYEMRRKLDLDGKDLVKSWISRNDQPPTQSSYSPEAHCKVRRKSEQDFLPESPFSRSSNDKFSRSEVEIGREDIDDWIIKGKSEKEEVLKTKEKILEVEPDVLFARKRHRHKEGKLQLSPASMKRWSKSDVTDIKRTEQRRPLCMKSLLMDDSAKSSIQETKDSVSVGSDSPSQSWTDSSSDERSSIRSSCPSTKSFVQGRCGHQHRNNSRNHAGGNRLKDCNTGSEERAVPNSWLLFVRGETQAPATGCRQLPEAAAAQVVTDQNIASNELSCSASSTNSCRKSSDEKNITLTSNVRDGNSLQSTVTKENDSDSHNHEMAEENESNSLRMATPTHGDRSSCRLVTPELGDNNSLGTATAKLVDTNCFSCQTITRESPYTIGADVPKSDEAVHSTAYITEQSNLGIRNTTKCVNNVDQMMEGEFCIMDDDVHLTANILSNDKTFSADAEPPPKRYKCFRELVISDSSSSLSIANCESQTRSESPVLMTTNMQTASLDVLSSPIHSSSHNTLFVTAGTQTSPICSPLTANACTSPAINSWTVDAQSSPMFGPSQPVVQSYTTLNRLGVDVSLSPVLFQPVKSSDAQLSPIFQYMTTQDAQLSPISNFFSTSAQQSPLLAENPKSPPLQKSFTSDIQSLPTSSETSSNLQTLGSISCNQPLLPLCAEVNIETAHAEVNIETVHAEVNIETVHTAEYSAQSEAVQNPSDTKELNESDICLDILTNKQDDVRRHVDAKLEGLGYSVVEVAAAFDGKPQMTMDERTPSLSCCVDDPVLSDVSFRGMMDRFKQNEDEVDKTDCSECVLQAAEETISCSVGLQVKTSFKPIEEDKVLEVLDVHDQCIKAMAEESCIATSFEVDKLSENDSKKLEEDSALSEDPHGVKVPDLVLLFNSGLEDTKRQHLLDSSASSSVYSSPMG